MLDRIIDPRRLRRGPHARLHGLACQAGSLPGVVGVLAAAAFVVPTAAAAAVLYSEATTVDRRHRPGRVWAAHVPDCCHLLTSEACQPSEPERAWCSWA